MYSLDLGTGGDWEPLWPLVFKVHTREQAELIMSFERDFADLKTVAKEEALIYCLKHIPGRGAANGRTDLLDERMDKNGEPCGFYCVYYGIRAAVYLDQ